MPWVEDDRSAKPKAPNTGNRKVASDSAKPEAVDLTVASVTTADAQHNSEASTADARSRNGKKSDEDSLEVITILPDVAVSDAVATKDPPKHGGKSPLKKAGTKVMEIPKVMSKKMHEAKEQLAQRVESHKIALHDNRPEVALLLPADITLPDRLVLCASASLRFHGKPARLFVLQLAMSEVEIALERGSAMTHVPSVQQTPADQLADIEKVLQKLSDACGERGEKLCLEDTQPWPLHEPQVSEALLTRESEVLGLESGSWFGGYFTRILHVLRILSPDEDGPVMNAFRDQHGPAAAFAAVWGFFFVQALWILTPFMILFLVLRFKPAASGTDRIKFEVVKGTMIVWGAAIAVLCSTRFLGDYAIRERERKKLKRKRSSDLTSSGSNLNSKPRVIRMLMLIFVAFPLLMLLGIFCMVALTGVTNLILHIIYVWGDCYNLHTPCEDPSRPLDCKDICRDAEKKHGVAGWAAEVGCDVALALLFELFFSLSSALADFVSELLHFEYENDRRYFKSMLEVSLSGLERIGFVFSLAFLFVPQWSEVKGDSQAIDMSIDCSNLWMGDSSYWCYQQRLPLALRRALLEKLMKGPFIVAPFIAILIKTIVPYVVYKLSQACDYLIRCPLRCFPLLPLRFIFRFFTLIFTLEGDNVGCFKFVCKGWPFSEVSLDSAPEASDTQPLQEYKKGVFSVLEQSVLKPFEADDELMELEMSFLWVLFFAPLRPEGVLTTLIAKVTEIYFDWLKMLHVRRRSFPVHDKVMRREQTSFVNAVVLGSVGWTLGLSFITYNDDLHKWGKGGTLIFFIMCAWLVFCAGLGFKRSVGMSCALGYATFVDLRKQDKQASFNELK